jgi:hypothetical protein
VDFTWGALWLGPSVFASPKFVTLVGRGSRTAQGTRKAAGSRITSTHCYAEMLPSRGVRRGWSRNASLNLFVSVALDALSPKITKHVAASHTAARHAVRPNKKPRVDTRCALRRRIGLFGSLALPILPTSTPKRALRTQSDTLRRSPAPKAVPLKTAPRSRWQPQR